MSHSLGNNSEINYLDIIFMNLQEINCQMREKGDLIIVKQRWETEITPM